MDLDCGWEIENPEHSAIYERVKPLLQTRFNALHTRISYHFAVKLLPGNDGDPEVVVPAILLHDIGWSVIPENLQQDAFGPEVRRPDLQRLHETEGARMAGDVLVDLGYSGHRIQEIQNIISGHDTRVEPLNRNDEIVKDSDKLWRYTHEGFSIDYKRFGKTRREHFIWLSEAVPKWFFLQASKTMAREELIKRKMDHGIEPDS